MIKLFFSKAINPKRYSKEFISNILEKELCIDKTEIIIDTDQYGKPYIKRKKNLHFNISHTKDMIACGLSDIPIGIDIEKIKLLNSAIIERFFTAGERDYIFFNNIEQDKRFFEIWTRKEAYVKWIGKGMEIGFDTFDVVNDTKIKTMHIDNYILSICANGINDKSIERFIVK